MPVCEEEDVAVDGPSLGDHAIGSLADLGCRLAVGSTVAPEAPARSVVADLGRRAAFVGAVVPLAEVFPFRGSVAEAGARGRSRARARGDW